MYRYLIIFLVLSFSSNSFAGIWDLTQIRSDLRVVDYNGFAEDYLSSRTNVTINGKSGKQLLIIEAPSPEKDFVGYPLEDNIRFYQHKEIEKHIAHIEKYLKWEKLASENGDAFTKEIGFAKGDGKLKYSFFSANEDYHLLEVSSCSFGSCGVSELFFDKENVLILLDLLKQLKAGELPPENVADKYN